MKILQKLTDTTAWPRLSRGAGWKLLIVWVIILSVLYSTMSVVRHNHFQSGGFDLGIYDQAVWQYSTFSYPYNTVKDRFILGDHFTLTLPLLAPLFWIWSDVRMLLIFQAIVLSISSLAVYKLVLVRKFSPFTALSLAFIYSLFYGIQYGLYFDFHPVLLATGLIPWMLYFMESKRGKLFVISLVALLLTQENMGIALASVGCVYFFYRKYRAIAIGFIFGGIAYSLIAIKIISLVSPVGFEYSPQITLNPVTNISRLFDHPEKRQTWMYTLGSYAFLPLFSPGALAAVTLDLSQYFVTGDRFFPMWTPFKHHRAILAPLIFLGALEVLSFLRRKKLPVAAIVAGLLIVTLAQQFLWHLPLNKLTKYDYWKYEAWMSDNERMIAEIPVDWAIAAQQSLIPHLSHRNMIYLVWPRVHDLTEKPCGQVSCWWLDVDADADYLLMDTHPDEWLTMLLETTPHVNEALSNMEKLGKITLLKQIRDIRLYRIH